MDKLKIGSLNVRGFRDHLKRQNIYNMFLLEGLDMMFFCKRHIAAILKRVGAGKDSLDGKPFGLLGVIIPVG